MASLVSWGRWPDFQVGFLHFGWVARLARKPGVSSEPLITLIRQQGDHALREEHPVREQQNGGEDDAEALASCLERAPECREPSTDRPGACRFRRGTTTLLVPLVEVRRW